MVKHSRFIHALKSVCAEVVALRLDEIRAELTAAESIDVLQGSGKRRNGHTALNSKGYDAAQTPLVAVDGGEEEIIEHEIFEIRFALIGVRNALQKFRLNDASRTEN